jgi:methyltransferase-like protein
VARRQIAQNAVKITNLRHERVKLDSFQRHVMRHLDGNHTLPELIEALAELVEMGQFSLKHRAQPVEDPQQIREMLTSLVQRTLPKLARQALLAA